ncbi:hypothetical protein ACLBXM_17020 [Xanthobacteraceae bacterium A53D]
MRIISLRPAGRGTPTLAHFDVELTPHLRLHNLALKRTANGQLRSFAPACRGRHAASFHPELGEQITSAAAAAWEAAAHGRR